MGDAAEATAGEEVKPYKIHIPTRHLDLTRRKLEFTRLPHEGSGLKDRWAPKAQVEELIDFWVEKYSWRDQESVLNTAFPQFRTSIALPSHSLASPLRIHFIHVRSAHSNAVPLLLLPPFPFTNLSFAHLVQPLTDPADPETTQPFHLVIPSLPGLGFSDPLPDTPTSSSPIPTAAALLDTLMTSRLAYPRYLATTAAPGGTSPAQIDWRLIRRLAAHHTTSCVGAHLISPVLDAPDVRTAPWEWTKWTVANFLRAGILGYDDEDFAALERVRGRGWLSDGWATDRGLESGLELAPGSGLNGLGRLTEPNALAYALCDSPVGMLVFVLRALWLSGVDPAREDGWFSRDKIVTLTKLAWLPGPEHALRFWAGCENHGEIEETRGGARAKVAISVFVGGGSNGDVEIAAAGEKYACPAWANAQYDVMHTQRYPGRSSAKGLLAFEQPDVIFAGVRGLAKALLAQNPRVFEAETTEPVVAPLEKVVVIKDGDDMQSKPGASTAVPLARGKGLSAPEVLATPAMTPAEEKEEDKTKGQDKDEEKGKGKEKEVADEAMLLAPAPIPVRDPLLDGESPDTLVEGSKTPPLEKTT